jgi:hypothetical protein
MGAEVAIVSYTHGFAFIANPKAGSTSIQAVLDAYQERPEFDTLERPGFYTARHVPARDLMRLLGPTWESLLTLAVVRNPYDWFVSQLAYNYRKTGTAIPACRKLRPDDVHRCIGLLRRYRGTEESAYASQWAFVCAGDRRLAVNLLLPFDDLERAWPHIGRMLGIGELPPLPRLNASVHPRWQEWLSPSTKAMIAHLWRKDVRLYEGARENWFGAHD